MSKQARFLVPKSMEISIYAGADFLLFALNEVLQHLITN